MEHLFTRIIADLFPESSERLPKSVQIGCAALQVILIVSLVVWLVWG